MTLSLRAWRYGSRASARSTKDSLGQLTIRAWRQAHGTDQGISSSSLQRWDSTIGAYWPHDLARLSTAEMVAIGTSLTVVAGQHRPLSPSILGSKAHNMSGRNKKPPKPRCVPNDPSH